MKESEILGNFSKIDGNGNLENLTLFDGSGILEKDIMFDESAIPENFAICDGSEILGGGSVLMEIGSWRNPPFVSKVR